MTIQSYRIRALKNVHRWPENALPTVADGDSALTHPVGRGEIQVQFNDESLWKENCCLMSENDIFMVYIPSGDSRRVTGQWFSGSPRLHLEPNQPSIYV